MKKKSVYNLQLLCLLSVIVTAVFAHGWRIVVSAVIALVAAVVTDFLGCVLSGKEHSAKDLTNVLTALCIALMLPATTSFFIIIFGVVLAISLKHAFGGKENYIFCPAALAVTFLIICYPSDTLLYPPPWEKVPVWGEYQGALSSGAETLARRLEAVQNLSPTELLTGGFVGAPGNVQVLVLIVCGVCLAASGALKVSASVLPAAIYLAYSLLFPPNELYQPTDIIKASLTNGYLLFGTVFLSSDPQTLPKTKAGRVYYGVVFGFIIILFHGFGKTEGPYLFALLISNVLALGCDSFAERVHHTVPPLFARLSARIHAYERTREKLRSGGAAAELDKTTELDSEEIAAFVMPPQNGKVTKFKRRFSFKLKMRAVSKKFADNKLLHTEIPIPEALRSPFKTTVGEAVTFVKKLKRKPPVIPQAELPTEMLPTSETPPVPTLLLPEEAATHLVDHSIQIDEFDELK